MNDCRHSAVPRLSVVLPVYNAESTVLRSVESVLDNTFRDLELVVVNDGSTDGTMDRLRTVDDARLRLVEIDHRGVAAAMNAGVARSRAAVLARMDADDWCAPDRFALQYAEIQSGSLDGVGGLVRIVDRECRTVPSMQRYEAWLNGLMTNEDIRAYRFVECPIANPSFMARREVFESGFRDGPWPEDYDFFLRIIRDGWRLGKVEQTIVHWTDGPGRLTREHPSYTARAFDRCRRRHLLEGPLQGRGTVDLWGGGKTGKPWLHWLLDEGIEVRRVIEVSPRRIGNSIRSVPLVSPEALSHCDGTPMVVAVGAEGARELILTFLLARGYVPGENAWFVA